MFGTNICIDSQYYQIISRKNYIMVAKYISPLWAAASLLVKYNQRLRLAKHDTSIL